MSLSLPEAALLAQLSPEDLILEINNGSLIAAKVDDEAEDTYKIEDYDLDAFLKKKSFDALWSESDSDEDNPEEPPLGPSIAGNLRRVLTAEAVSELKIQHQVLIARVQTLERLFSEFMDAEKNAENTLVLEDDWKIADASGQTQEPSVVAVSHEDLAEAATVQAAPSDNKVAAEVVDGIQPRGADGEQQVDMSEAEDEDPSEASPLQSNHAARRAYQLQTAEEARNALKQASEAEDEAEIGSPADAASAKSGKGLLAMKLKLMKSDKEALDNERAVLNIDTVEEIQAIQDDEQDENDDDGGTGIAERLQEYERRLAHAKQTATQMWH
jgi:hypothetical protein